MESKNNTSLIILATVCILLGAAGTVFGIVSALKSGKSSEDVKVTISKNDGTVEQIDSDAIKVEKGEVVIKETEIIKEPINIRSIHLTGSNVTIKVPEGYEVLRTKIDPCNWDSTGKRNCTGSSLYVAAVKDTKGDRIYWKETYNMFRTHDGSDIPFGITLALYNTGSEANCLNPEPYKGEEDIPEEEHETIYIGDSICGKVVPPVAKYPYQDAYSDEVSERILKDTRDWLMNKDNYIIEK